MWLGVLDREENHQYISAHNQKRYENETESPGVALIEQKNMIHILILETDMV